MSEVLICWGPQLLRISGDGHLMKYLSTLPRSRWMERDPEDGETLLHYATRGNNIDAVVALIKEGIDIDALNYSNSRCALHIAAWYDRNRICEILCACGANTQLTDRFIRTPFSDALYSSSSSRECAKVFIANGMRLKTEFHDPTLYHLYPFEQGVLKCRRAVISIIRIFQMGKIRIGCKYMVRELGVALWTTRKNENWQV